MNRAQKKIPENYIFYLASLGSFVLLILIVYLFPVEFSGYRITDASAPVWYLLTMTGGILGGSFIIIALLFYLIIHFKKKSKKIKNVYLFIGIVFIIQIIITGSTLLYFKEVFHQTRPSQLYFIEKGLIENEGRDYFAMSPDKKINYLQSKIEKNKKILEDVYPPILNSWVNDNGYSFPSGHAQTSFFLGTILAFVIYKTSSNKYYIFIPLIWAVLVAVSRVVIGIHFPFDVTVGAFMGLLIGLIVISLKKIKAIFN
ncbi:MAG: phosphatase PAP2 family protein [Bacteroidota bacterium]|nr:phosphatase PAP2 family protein [Bacteroidota bacterium]